MDYNNADIEQQNNATVLELPQINPTIIQRSNSQESFYSNGTGGADGQRYKNYTEYCEIKHSTDNCNYCYSCCILSGLGAGIGYCLYWIATQKQD